MNDDWKTLVNELNAALAQLNDRINAAVRKHEWSLRGDSNWSHFIAALDDALYRNRDRLTEALEAYETTLIPQGSTSTDVCSRCGMRADLLVLLSDEQWCSDCFKRDFLWLR